MRPTFRLLLCFLCLTLGGTPTLTSLDAPNVENSSVSFISTPESDPVTVTLLSKEASILPGRPFWVAIRLNIGNTWHAYWKNPGDAGMAPAITWNLPKDFRVESVLWPTPKRFVFGSSHSFGYEKEMILLARIVAPLAYPEGAINIGTDIRWVVCSDTTCLPGESTATLTLPVANRPPVKNKHMASTFRKAMAQIPKESDAISVRRNDDLLELVFQDPRVEAERKVEQADFFPEDKKAVNYSIPVLLERSETPNAVRLIVKEAQETSTLKGILLLHTNMGTESYAVDTPIISHELEENALIGMTFPPRAGVDSSLSSMPQEGSYEGGVLLAIALAFVGGLLLNLMPCVLPVLSLKILSFVKLAGQTRKLIFQHGLIFSLGVLLSFWVLASLLLLLQTYGRAVGWGFQLQEPIFVAFLAGLIFLFSLNLFGLFEMGTALMSAAGQLQSSSGQGSNKFVGSFSSGVLATVLATPCTGPFLGTAVGFAVTLPIWQALMIFTSLGLGMSFPYLLLAGFPGLLRFIPKPGPWMGVFKELMGFLMMAAVIWLIWVFSAQTNSLAVTLLLGGFFFLALAGWIYGRWGTPLQRKAIRVLGRSLALGVLCMGSYLLVVASSSWVEALGGGSNSHQISDQTHVADAWEEFSPERVAALREQGIPVFIDFTAKWCLICQANHISSLGVDEVSKKFSELGVVKMKADWTKSDPAITEELRKFGRNSVPLYVLYGSEGSEANILPQVLTPDIVLSALKELEEAL